MQQSATLESPGARSQGGDFLQDVIAGLSRPDKQLSPKYFYDQTGSEYFDRICELEEYYPFRAELELLPRVADEVTPVLTGDYAMVEFGAGSLLKAKPLLDCLCVRRFIPIDISGDHLRTACRHLQDEYPDLQVQALEGDFSEPLKLPASRHNNLGFFPGSTIGNFSPDEACNFLGSAGKTLGKRNYLLIGVDTKKSPRILHAAYNDAKGVTARFNLNILRRINRELQGDFALDKFEHYAFYNPALGRVEMHLISRADQKATIQGTEIDFRQGESIHTESSYKYTPAEFARLAESAGWQVERHWLARDNLFATYLLRYGS